MLKETFTDLLKPFTENPTIVRELWLEVERNYCDENRFYHTFGHLENVFQQLLSVREEIEHWEAVMFALYYHDIIYDASRGDNEERSAKLAQEKLTKANVDPSIVQRCYNHILATKSHDSSIDSDTNYFTDADLSVLGLDWNSYQLYCKKIRKEYSMYPDELYNPGRKKVLQHFLTMERIYKSDAFYEKFEEQAKSNIKKEMDVLFPLDKVKEIANRYKNQ